jgi:hypothetical protein
MYTVSPNRENGKMYGYKYEYCNGIVQERVIALEAFKHQDGFVTVENAPVGVCDKCGYRYYHSALLHRVEEIAAKRKAPERVEMVPVTAFV